MNRSQLRVFVSLAALVLATGCKSSPGPVDLVDFKPTANLQKTWKVSVGSAKDYVFQPAVVGASVYAASARGRVMRIDNGKTVWSIKTDEHLSGGVGSNGKLVVVADEKGYVTALDAATGKVVWHVNARIEVLAAPAVSRDIVMLRASDHHLVGLETKNGQQRWFYQRTSPPLALRSHAGIRLADGVALVGFPGGKVVGISLEHGGDLFELNVAHPRGSSDIERVADVAGLPVLRKNELCAVTYQGRAACFDVTNGNTLWERNFSSYAGMDRDDRFAVIVDDRDSVQALDAYSGTAVWRQDAMTRRQLSRPLLLGEYVITGDLKGYVHVLNRENGRFVARARADNSSIVADPVPLGHGFVVQTKDGEVVAFEIR